MLYHAHIPLGLHIPLVANNIGVSRFWLYQTISPGLGVSVLGQSLKPQFLSLATVEQSVLGAKSRTSIRRSTNRRFLSDWELEFPVIDVELQEALEASLPVETENDVKLPNAAETVLLERLIEPSTELSTDLPIESSTNPLFDPLVEELDSEDLDLTEAFPLRSSIKFPQESPQALLPESVKPYNDKLNSAKQKSRRKKNAKKTSSKRVKQLRIDGTQFGEQTEDRQGITDFLTQDEQWTRFQPERWSQILPEKPYPIVDTNSSEINLQAELPQESLNSHSKKNTVEFYAQKVFNPIQSDLDQIQTVQQQELETDLAQLNQCEEKVSRKNSKYHTSTKTQANSSKSEHLLAFEQGIISVDQDFNFNGTEQTETIIGKSFDHGNQGEANYFIDNHAAITKDDKQTELIQGEFEQASQSKLLRKIESLETINQSLKNLEPIRKVTAHAKFIRQISRLKNSPILEACVNRNIQQAELPLPIQGFSIGGQVKATTTSSQEIDPSDTVPAMLAPGEFVVNATDAQKHLPLLHHINQGGSLEEPTQLSSAKAAQITEQNVGRYEADTPALTYLPISAKLGVYPPLGNSETEELQSSIFTEPNLNQPIGYETPELIFRSKQASNLYPSSSPTILSSDSTNQWNSVEELLQTTDANILNFPSYQSTNQLSRQSANYSQNSAISISGGLPVSKSLTPLSHGLDLQPMETNGQAITNDTSPANEAKTLELVMETLAQELYSRLRQRLAIERERLGNFSGRLSW